jgi:pimeloyl-ACP methyl ester carboxylesterase
LESPGKTVRLAPGILGSAMAPERGTLARLPFAAVGEGAPVVVLPGLAPVTGVEGDGMLRGTLGPLAALAGTRRLVLFNRRPSLPAGMTMSQLADEPAEAIRDGLDPPVDVVGTSTGGSIAQQLAADHPELVRRLVLVSTACRLGPTGRLFQRRVAARIRAGATRQALAVMAAGLVPPHRGQLAAAVIAYALAPRLIGTADLDDMATTIEAEDGFDLAGCPPVEAATLILAGRDDRFYSPELFEETARLIPHSTLCLLEGRGHVTVMRDPRFGQELAAFLLAL